MNQQSAEQPDRPITQSDLWEPRAAVVPGRARRSRGGWITRIVALFRGLAGQ